MRVRDLGPLTVEVAGSQHALGGSRLAALLAVLAVNGNRRVSVDQLLEAVWGPDPGSHASTLDTHIWRLRQLLEPDRPRRAPSTILVSDTGGYRLVAGPDELDSLRFARLAAEIEADGGDHALVLDRSDEALALWRGQPFDPFTDAAWAEAEAARLTSLQARVEEQRIDALVDLGRPEAALADLERLIVDRPYNERLWAQRMLALFRLGRTEEALATYQRARSVLLDEVGVDPGADLRELQQRILQQDETLGRPVEIHPALRPPAAVTPSPAVAAPSPPAVVAESVSLAAVPTPARVTEVHLPARMTPLLGRADELTRLGRLIEQFPLVTITGAAGSGKTRLSVDVARGAAAGSPDGVWFVDLSATEGDDVVAEVIASTVGFDAPPGLSAADALSDYLSSRAVLLVLDNCEHLLDQVGAIVDRVLTRTGTGAAAASRILATSREPLGVDGEVIWTLEPLPVPSLDEDDDSAEGAPVPAALALFLARVTAADPTIVVDEAGRRAAREICVAVDGLPLALELAAARARSSTLDEIAEQVRRDPARLAAVSTGQGSHASVLAAIDFSYRLLSPAEQLMHRRIAVLPGPFVRQTAAALVANDLPDELTAVDVLPMLVHRSMLASIRSPQAGGASRFRQLAPVRAHARLELERAAEVDESLARRDAWALDLVRTHPPLNRTGVAGWYDRVAESYSAVRAILHQHLEQQPSETGVWLAARLTPMWFNRMRLVEGTRWLGLAVEITELRESVDSGLCRISLAAALSLRGGDVVLRPLVERAIADLARAEPHLIPQVASQVGLLARGLWTRGELAVLDLIADLIAGFAARLDDPDLELLTDALRCLNPGDRSPDEAARTAEAVHARAVALDNPIAGYFGAAGRTLAAVARDRPDEGVAWSDRTREMSRRLGEANPALYLETRGNMAVLGGEPAEAARLFAASEREAARDGLRWPLRALTAGSLARIRDTLTPDELDQARRDGARLTEADVAR
jgi:predicted ATPase/DNA-binding SARP family transcriptional activator